jgi:hypothetical protein
MLFLTQHLSEKRSLAGRSENLDELSREQLLDEKLAVQKALLYLEGIFGRPVTRGDRYLVRPLYDRYRALKRLVIRSGPVSKTCDPYSTGAEHSLSLNLFRASKWQHVTISFLP